MELRGETVVGAPPEAVWAALLDPERLKALIPGCESMTGDPACGYSITVARGVGAVAARLSGRIELSEMVPARSVLLHAQGTGGAAGLARGTARIRLEPVPEGTRLAWDIAAEVGGRLAALPRVLVEGAARRVADGFVDRFARSLDGRERSRGWLSRLVGG